MPEHSLNVRPAQPVDAAAITAIYAHHVLHGTGTFEEEPPSVEEIGQRLAAVMGRGWPWLVASDGERTLGYAYAAQFRDRAAYRYACEDSVYVAAEAMGRGVGRALLDALIAAATDAGFRQMLAVIGDSANAASIRVHEAAGFVSAGKFEAVGHKFGRELDVVFMQRALAQ